MVVFQNQVIGIGSEEQILFVRRSGWLSNRERPKGDNEEYETIDLTIDGDSEDEQGGASTFLQVLLRREHVKLVSDLVSDDVHLKIIMCWSGSGEGKNGVKDTVNAVINLLAFPFVAVQNVPSSPSNAAAAAASVNSGFLLNMGSPGGKVSADDKDMVRSIEASMGKYLQILLEVLIPGQTIPCLRHVELKDAARLVAFLTK